MSPIPNWFSRKSKESESGADAGNSPAGPGGAGTATPAGNVMLLATEPKTGAALEIENKVIDALKTVFDPEIPVNIYELGLIYGIEVTPEQAVVVHMTLTAPNCPAAESMPAEIREKTRAIEGVTDATTDITFEPPWDPSRMTEAAKLELGMF